VSSAIRNTSNQYGKLLTAGGPNFDYAATRFGYVYMYVSAHAHWLHELITMRPEAKSLFDKKKLRMVCLGGGPGSDLVGVLKFMDTRGKSLSLHCEIVDGCIAWKTTWSDVAFTLDWPDPLHTDYVVHDAGAPTTWTAPSNVGKADLITLNFFVSEIYHLGDVAADYLKLMLGKAKPGTIVLMNDNNDSRFYNWFDSITAALGFTTLLSEEGERKIYDYGEQKSELADYEAKFGWVSPKLTGQLCWRILKKS
jgi:hypothetical protein